MNRQQCFRMIACLSVLLAACAVPAFSEPMGVSGGFDLDRLWSEAQRMFDLSRLDAVLLLESRRVTISADGNRRTAVHRVVWIGTEIGIDDHADLRIPYNSAVSTFTVAALRTWRDERWWPHPTQVSETAVVETLPFAMARADDYTSMRETMLLHDGVEIPCIIETAYEITERGTAVEGADGLFVFSQSDPAVVVEFTIGIPEGKALAFHSGNGAPEPASNTEADRTVTYAWRMENVGRLGSPRISDPASYAPHVAWSIWKDWNALGRKIVSSFNDAAVIDAALADTLAEHLKHEPSLASRARAVAALVNEYTRTINYDSRFWQFSPRPAPRTWETAYGHGLDRAVLAAALFREAGLEAEPVFRSTGPRGIDHGTPGLSRFEEIGVLVSGDGLQAFYDPVDGILSGGPRPLHGRVAWIPGNENIPALRPDPGATGTASRFELILTLEPGGEKGWNGTGFLNADGQFCPYDEMVGLHGEALNLLGRIAGSVLTGAEVSGFNPEVFETTLITVGFDFAVKTDEPDERGRMRLTIGDPAGGIMAALPPDVHIHHEHRTSPVLIPGRITQRVRLRIRTGDREVVYLPQARVIENEIGRCSLSVENNNGWVVIDRELILDAAAIQAQSWPQLRTLLLEESDASCRTIIFR